MRILLFVTVLALLLVSVWPFIEYLYLTVKEKYNSFIKVDDKNDLKEIFSEEEDETK